MGNRKANRRGSDRSDVVRAEVQGLLEGEEGRFRETWVSKA